MRIPKGLTLLLPIALLMGLGLVRWQIWKRDNPPVTRADLKLRGILRKSEVIQFGFGGKRFSSNQKRTLIDHLWLTTDSIEATYPTPSGQKMKIWFKLKPGQGTVTLHPDAAFSGVSIEHWAFEPGLNGSPPFTTSEEEFTLHPASNRFLRAWLSAGAP